MQRNSAKRAKKATQNAPTPAKFNARSEIALLKSRIAKLEAKFEDAGDFDARFVPDFRTPKVRRGPKAKHPREIYRVRDEFVRFFEQYWPELEPLCSPKPNMRALRSIFASYPRERSPQMYEIAQMLLQRISVLETFLTLHRDRFRDNPRTLAGALAGAPGISLWHSLRLCPPSNCGVPIHPAAVRFHIKRKHYEVYQRLLASTDLLLVTQWWREFRTRDKWLRDRTAVELIGLWNASGSEYDPLPKTYSASR